MITSKVPGTGIEPKAGGWLLLAGPRSLNATLLHAIARLGERGPLRIFDGGNRFNAYSVARQARGRPEVLGRITVSRAFTCYQVLALLEGTPAAACPFVVLDLLNTFYDESVPPGERKRLLRLCLPHLQRLAAAAGGVVSLHAPAVASPLAVELLHLLQAAALDCLFVQPPAPLSEPPGLFHT